MVKQVINVEFYKDKISKNLPFYAKGSFPKNGDGHSIRFLGNAETLGGLVSEIHDAIDQDDRELPINVTIERTYNGGQELEIRESFGRYNLMGRRVDFNSTNLRNDF